MKWEYNHSHTMWRLCCAADWPSIRPFCQNATQREKHHESNGLLRRRRYPFWRTRQTAHYRSDRCGGAYYQNHHLRHGLGHLEGQKSRNFRRSDAPTTAMPLGWNREVSRCCITNPYLYAESVSLGIFRIRVKLRGRLPLLWYNTLNYKSFLK